MKNRHSTVSADNSPANTDSKDEIINIVKQGFFDEFLHPLQEQLKEIRKKSMDKEQTLKEAKEKLVILKQKRQEIEVQLQGIM